MVIVSKYQVDSQSTIYLLIRKLMTGIPDLMLSFGNNISNFIKEIRSVETDIHARGEDPGNLFLKLFTTYDDCSSDNGPFTCYIFMLENQYNNTTLKFYSKDFMYEAEVKSNEIKDELNFKGNSKVEDQILTLKAEIG